MNYPDQVKEFHEKFELDVRDCPYREVFDNEKLLNLRMKLVEEEFTELREAVANRDFTEVVDAICDLHYVLSGFSVSIGVNEADAFEAVHKSNMSKLCDTEEQAKETVVMYRETRPQFDPGYRKTKDGTKWLVFDKITGKVLKNKYYEPVDLSRFC